MALDVFSDIDTTATGDDFYEAVVKCDGNWAIMNATFGQGTNEAAELYYSGNKAFEVYASGIKIYRPATGEETQIYLDTSGHVYFANQEDEGWIYIRGKDTGSNVTELITCDPDGPVDLYHDGTNVAGTNSEGLYVTGGINFPDSQSASTDANTLDDYEEGAWTPTAADAASGGNTATTGTGQYTKIGRMVYATGIITNVDTTALTGVNTFYVQGLPFACGDVSWFGACIFDQVDLQAAGTTGRGVVPRVDTGASATWFWINSDATYDIVKCSDLTDDTADLGITIIYSV